MEINRMFETSSHTGFVEPWPFIPFCAIINWLKKLVYCESDKIKKNFILNVIRSVHATEIRSSWWKTPQNASIVAYLWDTKTLYFHIFHFILTTTFLLPINAVST